MAITADPSTWPAPQYLNPPESREHLILGINSTTTILMILFISCRLHSRSILKKRLSTDDYIIFVAAVFAFAIGIVCNVTIRYGNGRHIYDIKPEWIIPLGKLTIAVNIIFPTAVSLTKISLCLTYLRLFPSQTNLWFCYGVITFLTLWCVAITLTNILQCIPLASYFDPSITHKKCINWEASLVSTAALNSATDLVVFLWPALYIVTIQLPIRQRIGLVFIFCTGVIVCLAGLIRLYRCFAYFKAWDRAWEASIIWILGSTEINIGVICACLSSIKPILIHYFPRHFRSWTASNSRDLPPQSFTFQSIGRKRVRRLSSEEDLSPHDHTWASVEEGRESEELPKEGVIEVPTAAEGENSSSRDRERINTDGYSEERIVGGADQT